MSVDTWLAANQQFSSSGTSTAPQCDRPPQQASFSFEVIPELSAPKGVYITEADLDEDVSIDNYPIELYNIFEVFTTKKTDNTQSCIH